MPGSHWNSFCFSNFKYAECYDCCGLPPISYAVPATPLYFLEVQPPHAQVVDIKVLMRVRPPQRQRTVAQFSAAGYCREGETIVAKRCTDESVDVVYSCTFERPRVRRT
jgi:hypothetical protein